MNTPRFHSHMPMSLVSLVLKEFKMSTPKVSSTHTKSKNKIQGPALTHSDLVTPSGTTLAQVMACCLTAPSHYLNQC